MQAEFSKSSGSGVGVTNPGQGKKRYSTKAYEG